MKKNIMSKYYGTTAALIALLAGIIVLSLDTKIAEAQSRGDFSWSALRSN